MNYGILDLDVTYKLFDKINKRKLCAKCKEERKLYLPADRKNYGCESNLLLGFSSPQIRIPLDLLIIAQAHAGGKQTYRSQRDTNFEVKNLGDYYLDPERNLNNLRTFHQKECRILFRYLNSRKISWLFTDLIKSYVSSDKKNMQIAVKHCSKYLTEQIQILEPKKILCLGKLVSKHISKLESKQIQHGSVFVTHINNKNTRIIFSMFPSARTSDKWIEIGGWRKIIPLLLKA